MGTGSITVGLARSVASVVGVDLHATGFRPAMAYLEAESIPNVRFVAANASALPFPDAVFDAVLLHSVLEAAAEPIDLLREAWRVLVPGGVVAAASVEYGGRILAGPQLERLQRFYAVREQLWALDRLARPRAGRELRRLLHAMGFTDIDATAHYLSYGTPEAVRFFGEARSAECSQAWFASRSLAHGLLSEAELRQTRAAWQEWARSPDSFCAFAWCRVVGHKPLRRRMRYSSRGLTTDRKEPEHDR
jgi:ubiquinone/menaquinone biosynthesis C-methylase UbiE